MRLRRSVAAGISRLAEPLTTVPGDGGGQRMIAQRSRRRPQRSSSASGHAVDGMTSVIRGRPSVSVPVLSKAMAFSAQILERRAALDQHAAARRPCDARQHGARRGDRQRAGTGRHQHRHGAIEAVAEGFVDHHPGEQQQHASASTAGTKIRSKRSVKRWVGDFCVSASLTICTTLASVESLGLAGDLDLDRARAVDGAGEDRGRRNLVRLAPQRPRDRRPVACRPGCSRRSPAPG
jgi:hypothetical protein